MYKVGLTGGIASGKSTVTQLFSNLGIDIIDADIIAHELVEPGQVCYLEIVDTFGLEIVSENGTINRPLMRKIIFNDSASKLKLEQILHPRIRQAIFTQSEQAKSPYCILSIPLLIESNMTELVNRTLVIDTEPEQQLQRLMRRDIHTKLEAERIINSQVSRSERLKYADDIILNDGPISTLSEQIDKLDKKYQKLASSSCQYANTHGQ